MDKRINWLHLTDLHYGQKNQNILLPKIKNDFFKDIEYIREEIGKIDIVFFSGDLTQSGTKEEFDQLTAFLKELWSLFKKLNCEPLLLAIPGNHDLSRPDPSKAAVKVLRNYQNDKELQESLWTNFEKKGEYYDVINQSFFNFTQWYKSLEIPKPSLIEGLVPGDLSAKLKINNINLNVVGLNTAFLELSGDDYLGKLAINPLQLLRLTENDPIKWAEKADISILMTHHDSTWYDEASKEFYLNDFNAPGAYYSHLCGHLHTANTYQHITLGSEPRRTQLCPSLFGLQKINNKTDRIHGYYAGSYIIEENIITELFYPRKSIQRYDGSLAIESDIGFALNKKGYIEIKTTIKEPNEELNEENSIPRNASGNTLDESVLDILKQDALTTHIKELEKIPKVTYSLKNEHSEIRLVEQSKFVDLIKNNRVAWLITDWGMDENGFIGSLSRLLEIGDSKTNFIINCEDIASDTELLSAFEIQFGMTLQKFCNVAFGLPTALLVFDHLNHNIYNNKTTYNRFLEIVNSIIDYCPHISIVLIARQVPELCPTGKFIKLLPLDVSQIKSYIENHSGETEELKVPENLHKIAEITSGLPKHIDRIIEGLKFTNLEELLEVEREAPSDIVIVEEVPKSLIQAISGLYNTTDKVKQRSLKLLKILTVLADGESFNNLKKFDGTEPIFLNHVTELERLSLLEVITTSRVLGKVGTDSFTIKVLRAPRQIRDYVNTLITENEKENIVRQACNMYFGSRWREGIIRDIYSNSFFTPTKFFNINNCHLIINHLIGTACKNSNSDAIERASLIAVNFCRSVKVANDYKNAINTAEEVYTWLKPTSHNNFKATIAKLYGSALRMIGQSEKSNALLNEALNIENGQLSNTEKNEIYSELALGYLSDNNYIEAIRCAREVEKNSKPKTGKYVQAKYVIARATLEGEALMKKLRSLESEARRIESVTLTNNISIYIAEKQSNSHEREQRLAKILSGKGDNYNKMRAIIKKTQDSLDSGDNKISETELLLLNQSYSYLYVQRIDSIFTDCHVALWDYCVFHGRLGDLLNLYKHSSLVWRIAGKNKIEKKYYILLSEQIESKKLILKNEIDIVNLDYYDRRQLEFNSKKILLNN